MSDESGVLKYVLVTGGLTVGAFGGLLGQLLHLPGWAGGVISAMMLIGVFLYLVNGDE